MDKKIQLIPDIECNLDQENIDLMGTLPYVDVLEKIIEENIENYTPFTIGLFGGWGSGKSSIIKTLSERLSKKNKIKSVVYDAWKYSGDAFRRSFVLELKNQLELGWEESLEVFYREKHEDVSIKTDITKNWFLSYMHLIPLLGLLILVSSAEIAVKGWFGFFSIILTIYFFLFKETFVQYKISVTTPKIFSPEQFKEVFDQAIDDTTGEEHSWFRRWWKKVVRKEDKCKQVVIVIDNIDRCDKETAKELLLNIKTYLEHKRCIVIVPVDDVAIKSHLKYIGDEEAEEFLRKIFNVSIRIKGLNNIDRYEFTKNLIEKYSLGFSNEVASVISQEFAKNPRRIIQFLNSLALEREVAREQEAKGLISDGSVTKNVDFLAKILLIKEEYPFLYDAIIFDGLNLSKWEELCKDGKHAKEKRELQMFFGRTSGLIAPQNITSFLLLRSKNDMISPEFVSLIQAGQAQEVMSRIEKDSIDFNILLNYLNDTLDTKLIRRNVTANPELSFLLWCFSKDEINKILEKRQTEFFRYFNYINQEHIEGFSFPDSAKTARYLKQIGQIGLYNTIVSYIKSNFNKSLPMIFDFIKVFNLQNDLLEIQGPINNLLKNELGHFETLLPYLKDKNLSQNYIKPETISKHVSTLSTNRTDNDVKICQAVKSCFLIQMLPEDIHGMFLQKVLDFLQSEQSPVCYKFWLEQVKGCLRLNTSGAQLFQFLKQTFDSPVFQSRDNVEWREVLQVMVLIFEEYIILGEVSGWECLSKVYLLGDDLSLSANNSLKEIIRKTNIKKWVFLDDVIKKTMNTSVSSEFFVVAGEILQKGKGQTFLSEKPELLKNWMNFIVNKEEVTEDEQAILKMYCEEDIFRGICQQDIGLAKSLFAKAKSLSMKEVIDSIAEVILQDASLGDVKYLVEQQYEKADSIKNAIKQGIEKAGEEEFEWLNLVVEKEDIWTMGEYKDLLEERLLHLATGNNDQKEQVKQIWVKVNKNKISRGKVSIIEKAILEREKEITEEDVNKESEAGKE